MASTEKMVTTVFRDRMSADSAFNWLHSIGYNSSEINVLMSDKTRSTYYRDEPKGKNSVGNYATEGTAVGGTIGTAVGATVAAIVAIGTSLVIPGLNLVIAGPIAAALAGAGAGAVSGGVIGCLVGWGIPEDNAKAYQEALKSGGVVMGVRARNSKDASNIKEKFEELDGEDIICTSAK